MHLKIILTAGFAIFSMFFGSGNLVFPLYLGQITGDKYVVAFIGLFLTAVIVPSLGLFSMVLFQGNKKDFFKTLGKKSSFILIFIMLSLLGPLGVVPRCITVAYGSLKVAYPNFSFYLFCLLFCIAIAILIWRKNKVVEIIGIFLTPWKLGGILVLIISGLLSGSNPIQKEIGFSNILIQGGIMGYQTMDLIGSFFFSSTIIDYMREKIFSSLKDFKEEKKIKILTILSLKASVLGALLLTVIYMGFVMMGAKHSSNLGSVKSDELLTVIASNSLGESSAIIVAITLIVACLATAVILTEVFVEFIEMDIFRFRISHSCCVIVTLLVSFIISLLGFERISELLSIFLTFTYPSLIIFTIIRIIDFFYKTSLSGLFFWMSLLLCGIYNSIIFWYY